MKYILYVGRHVAVVSLAAALAAVLWTVVYFLLLFIAIVTDGGIGSPISYPLWLVFLVLCISIIGLLIFAPACAVGRIFVGVTSLPQIAAIPVVFGAGAFLSHAVYHLYLLAVTTHSLPPFTIVFWNYCIYLSVPLGAYWWLVDGPFAVIDAIHRWLRRRSTALISPHPDPSE